jgi:hypothetical protein
VPTRNWRRIAAALLLSAALGAASGGFTVATLQDSDDADVNASVVDQIQVEATAVSVTPAAIDTSQDSRNRTVSPQVLGPKPVNGTVSNTSQDSLYVTVTLEVPAPEDVDETTFEASLDEPDSGSIQAVDANTSCDSSDCTVVFERSAVESLSTATGTYTLVVTGEYDDGGPFRGEGAIEFCDTNCDDTANATVLTAPHGERASSLAGRLGTITTEVTNHGRP